MLNMRAAWVAVMLGAVSAPAHAQAVLVSSVPAAGAKVSAGEFTFHLRFNSPIDHERSRLTLMHPDGSAEYLVIAMAGPPQDLNALARLTEGAYVLRWDVLPIGGPATSGSLRFTAGAH
jgi:methionine-rich copper-binding protein CopC